MIQSYWINYNKSYARFVGTVIDKIANFNVEKKFPPKVSFLNRIQWLLYFFIIIQITLKSEKFYSLVTNKFLFSRVDIKYCISEVILFSASTSQTKVKMIKQTRFQRQNLLNDKASIIRVTNPQSSMNRSRYHILFTIRLAMWQVPLSSIRMLNFFS